MQDDYMLFEAVAVIGGMIMCGVIILCVLIS